MNQEHARAVLWQCGLLAEWQLREDQYPVYEHLKKHRKPFLECSRRYGKTTTILIYVQEQLRANPGWICRWVLPEKEQARTILKPEMERIQLDCPEDEQFHWHHVDSFYEHKNGSKIYVYGVDKDRGKGKRGLKSNIVVCDEYGFWGHPGVVASVFGPQLLTTRGQLIFASTPSEDLAHPYYDYKEEAERDGRLIQRFVQDNASLTEEDIAQAAIDCGGRESPVFQREYLLNPMADPDRLVIPEYKEELCLIEDDVPRPAHFHCIMAGDSGTDDNTFLLFGYYDFLKDEDVIEEEICIRGVTSAKIVELAKAKELELWGEVHKPTARAYDASKQLLLDISSHHNYSVFLPDKHGKHAAIHQWRQRVSQGKFKIKRRCRNLHRQMKVGMWRDEKKTDFTRSDELGHLDGIAAGLYFTRTLDRRRNPYPPSYGYNADSQFISSFELNRAPDNRSDASVLSKGLRPTSRRGFGT